MKGKKDIGASVRARLLRLAQDRGDDFQLLLTRYANERLLYRLAKSPHVGHFMLKGAALFTLWTGHAHRATRGMDLLGDGEPSAERLRAIFTEVIALDVADDGVVFDTKSLHVEPIRKDQAHGGIRIIMVARVTAAQVRLQIDVGFGDAVTPPAQLVEFPALLDFPAPQLRAYPKETVVAETSPSSSSSGPCVRPPSPSRSRRTGPVPVLGCSARASSDAPAARFSSSTPSASDRRTACRRC